MELGLLGSVCEGPEAVPGKTKGGTFESVSGGQELGVSSGRCFTYLGRGIVVVSIRPVDSIKGVDCILNSATKCTNGVLMYTFWNYTGKWLDVVPI